MKKNVVFAIIVAILVLISIIVVGMNISLNPIEKGKDLKIAVDDTIKEDVELVKEPENKNILIVGSDKSGELADVIMLAKINVKEKDVKIISIPRDTRIKVNGEFMKINSTLGLGNINGTKQAVEYVLKTKIDNYVLFSTDTFRDTIDALGGVDFYVPQDMKYSDPVQDLKINLKKGYQHLDGDKAEQLVRFRKYTMGDLDRIKVQQDFFKELINQKLNHTLLNNADELIKTILTNINSDLTIKDLFPYIDLLKSINNINVEFYTIPGSPDYVGDISYFLIDEEEVSEFMVTYGKKPEIETNIIEETTESFSENSVE